MGLREALKDFITMQEVSGAAKAATGKFAADTEALAAKQDLRSLASQIPGAIQSGDFSGVAGDAYALGDPSLLKMTLESRMNSAKTAGKPGDEPITDDNTLRSAFPGMDDDWYDAAKSASSRAQQGREFAAIGTQVDRDADRGLRREGQYEKTRSNFISSVDDKLKKYKEKVDAFEALEELDPYTNVGFWPQVSTIIKKVGMDAGALSDQDMQRFIAATGQRTMTQALQYLNLIDPSKNSVDDKTIKAVTEVISKMKKHSQDKLKERAAVELLQRANVGASRLPDDLVKDKALDFGLVANKKDGKWTIGESVEIGKSKPDLDLRGASQDAMGMVKALPANLQAPALRKLEEFNRAGKPPSPAFMQKLKEMAGTK